MGVNISNLSIMLLNRVIMLNYAHIYLATITLKIVLT